MAQVGGHHPALDVVAAEAEGHLGQVVRPEGEEVGLLGDLVGEQGGPRSLDHRPDGDLDPLGDLGARRGLRWRGILQGLHDPGTGERHLLARDRERDHYLDDRVPAAAARS